MWYHHIVILSLSLALVSCAGNQSNTAEKAAGKKIFWTEYTGIKPGSYATYEESYSQEGLQAAVMIFDPASAMEAKSLPQGTPFTETTSFSVMKKYRYNVYMTMYGEYLTIKYCGYKDQYSQQYAKLFPVVRRNMYKTLAKFIIKPLEKGINKSFKEEKPNCADRGLTQLPNNEQWTMQRLWGDKVKRLYQVMQRSSF